MSFDRQPTLVGELLELRPLQADDFAALFRVASDNGEMKRLMPEHAFRSVNRVIFVIGPENRRSRRAVEKIGGVRAGTTTDAKGRERVVDEITPSLFGGRNEAGPA